MNLGDTVRFIYGSTPVSGELVNYDHHRVRWLVRFARMLPCAPPCVWVPEANLVLDATNGCECPRGYHLPYCENYDGPEYYGEPAMNDDERMEVLRRRMMMP